MPEADIKDSDKWLHPTYIVGCSYLSLPLIPASGTTLLKCNWILVISGLTNGSLVAWQRQNISYANVDLSLRKSSGIHLI